MKLECTATSLLRPLALSTLIHGLSTAAATFNQEYLLNSKGGSGTKGAVASEAIECSTIGRDLLAQGGNAVDALVGTVFCVGVVGMYHSGIGGGGFALVRDRDGEFEAIDFRESAPAAAYEDMYEGNVDGSVIGGLSAGVPGEVRGLEYMHTKYGDLPWKTVMAGAIHVAREGFKVSADMYRIMQTAIRTYKRNFLLEMPAWAEDFAPNGTLVGVGDHMTRKKYADTLERIANEGAEVFYRGDIAKSMIKSIQATNGTMTLEDLAAYQVISRNVTSIKYRGHTVHGIGSPAGGAISFSILKTMEQYSPKDWSDVPLSAHRLDEAMRFAYGARLELGDPDFVPNVPQMEDAILTDERAEWIRGRILDNTTQPVKNYMPKRLYQKENHGTSHMATADDSGMATSMTTTINLLFGSLVVDPDTGIIINNEMNDFSIPGVSNEFDFPPSPANFIRPNKRPLSSCTPMIVTTASPSGERFLATLGAGGGSRIISATAQVLWHVVEHGHSMAQAIAEPRLHDQLMPNQSVVEYAFNNDTVAQGLLERGHDVVRVAPVLSAVQGILLGDDGVFEAAGEYRQVNSGGLAL